MISVPGISEYEEKAPLDNGTYNVECTRALKRNMGTEDDPKEKLILEFVVTAGPAQRNGSDPEDQTLTAFFSLDHYDEMKDGGEFQKGQLKAAIDAMGIELDGDDFDEEEFVGKSCQVRTKLKKYEGEYSAQISKFKPLA